MRTQRTNKGSYEQRNYSSQTVHMLIEYLGTLEQEWSK